jgi:hypothetical protein
MKETEVMNKEVEHGKQLTMIINQQIVDVNTTA